LWGISLRQQILFTKSAISLKELNQIWLIAGKEFSMLLKNFGKIHHVQITPQSL
jgi:hypothetical protein